MKGEMLKIVTLSVSLSVLALGCSDGDDSRAGEVIQDNPLLGQDTPALLAQKWGKSLRTNDLKSFLESCTPEHGDWPKAQEAWLSLAASSRHFRESLLERHGVDAWEYYHAYCKNKGFMRINAFPDNESWAQDLRTVELEGKAYFYGWDGDRFRIVHRDGVWYFDFAFRHINPPSTIAKEYFRVGRVVEQVAREVEENNVSIESAAEMIEETLRK